MRRSKSRAAADTKRTSCFSVEDDTIKETGATQARVLALMSALESESSRQTEAAMELRLLAKWSMGNRILMGECGCIAPLLALLSSTDPKAQENAVTCLLNLSIFQPNRLKIIDAPNSLDSISETLKSGLTTNSKSSAAALLTSLMVVEEFRDAVGKNAVAIIAIFQLLRSPDFQSRKDAIKAMFQLSLWAPNRSRLVRAGAIAPLMRLLKSPSAGLVEDTLAVLAQMARSKDGTMALKDAATISMIMDFLEHGSGVAQENAAGLLLALCETGKERLEKLVRRHRRVIVGVLYKILAGGSERGKKKANALMNMLVASDDTGEMVFDLLNASSGDRRVIEDYESRKRSGGSWCGSSTSSSIELDE